MRSLVWFQAGATLAWLMLQPERMVLSPVVVVRLIIVLLCVTAATAQNSSCELCTPQAASSTSHFDFWWSCTGLCGIQLDV
jgi:hypothetical protein